MSEQYPYQPQHYPPPNPGVPSKNRHWVRWALAVGAVLVVGAGIGAATSSPAKHAAKVATTTAHRAMSSAPAVAPAAKTTAEAPPAAVPDPAGTVTGSCAYELVFDNIEPGHDHMGDLNGEVDVANTGNIGTVVKVTITWPQLGHPAIKVVKSVKVAYGQTVTVPFTRPATTSVIDRLQSWQNSHDFKDGCTYDGSIVDTYGPAH